jgi:hypothetical protein
MSYFDSAAYSQGKRADSFKSQSHRGADKDRKGRKGERGNSYTGGGPIRPPQILASAQVDNSNTNQEKNEFRTFKEFEFFADASSPNPVKNFHRIEDHSNRSNVLRLKSNSI